SESHWGVSLARKGWGVGPKADRLRDRVDALRVALRADEAANPGAGAVEHVLVLRTRGLVVLAVLALDHLRVDPAGVEHVAELRLRQVVESRVVLEVDTLE